MRCWNADRKFRASRVPGILIQRTRNSENSSTIVRRNFDDETDARYVAVAAKAVRHCHAAGVIHRDIGLDGCHRPWQCLRLSDRYVIRRGDGPCAKKWTVFEHFTALFAPVFPSSPSLSPGGTTKNWNSKGSTALKRLMSGVLAIVGFRMC